MLAAALALLLVAAYCVWAARRPLPAVAADLPVATVRAAVPHGKGLTWPAGGQAAVGIAGTRILDTHGKQAGVPTASTAKLITVLCILRQKPLAPGQQGPTITMTAHDEAIFRAYAGKDGSLVPVKTGEKITEYQALQAILLPSSNNMADSLAIWAFGSLKAYSAYANNYVKSLGLADTHIGPDASGFNPATRSSARDLVGIGRIVMENPVLSKIVGQSTANVPIAGKVRNVNFLLGNYGIVGIKTGNTDQAGGVFVGASKLKVNGRSVTVITAVTKSHDLFSAMKGSLSLIKSARGNFNRTSVIKAGTIVGHYDLPWGGSVLAATDQPIILKGWGDTYIPFTVQLNPLEQGAKAGQTVGQVTVKKSALYAGQSVPVKLTTTPPSPSVRWRLLHP